MARNGSSARLGRLSPGVERIGVFGTSVPDDLLTVALRRPRSSSLSRRRTSVGGTTHYGRSSGSQAEQP